MIYKNNYIYPPRPENTFPRNGMNSFDNGTFLGQPKFDGTCAEIYIGGDNWKSMNRHKSTLTDFRIKKDEVISILDNYGVNMFVGEYMNKSKNDEHNEVFNHKLVIFDIIVYKNEHLIGKTFRERLDILTGMLKPIDENDYSYKITENIYYTKTFYKDFGILWDEFVKVDMLEGLVLKRTNAGLDLGISQKSCSSSMCKCRKSTKLYEY